MFILFENFYRRSYGTKMEHQKIQWQLYKRFLVEKNAVQNAGIRIR